MVREIIVNRLEKDAWCHAAAFYGSFEKPEFTIYSSDINVFTIVEQNGLAELRNLADNFLLTRGVVVKFEAFTRKRCELPIAPISRALFNALPPVVSGRNIRSTPRWFIREDAKFPSAQESLLGLIKDTEHVLHRGLDARPESPEDTELLMTILDRPFHLMRHYLLWRGIETTERSDPDDLYFAITNELLAHGDRDWEVWAGQLTTSLTNLRELKANYRNVMQSLDSLPILRTFTRQGTNRDMLGKVRAEHQMLVYALKGLRLAILHSKEPS